MSKEWKFKLPEVKVRLSKLQKWIMDNCDNEEGLGQGDVYNQYYLDNQEIETSIIRFREMKKWKERQKLIAKLKSRRSSISLAFNQLYLQKLVQRRVTNGLSSGWYWQSIDNQLTDFINYQSKEIQNYEEMFEKDPSLKKSIYAFRLKNFYNRKEKAERCEIMLTKDWNKLINMHRPGRFVLVGSELHMSTWPECIRKIKLCH